ncbi:MAG: tripartite ATP-independent transporter DctM subunit [Granulosicoccus sp.]|jgi:tripartite ATP-independent transporter DctM subunit
MSIEAFWILVLIVSLFSAILSGVPVMLAIAGAPIVVAFAASIFGHFDLSYLAAFPQRILGVMNNSLLIAIPLFVLMGIVLDQSKQAEKLLLNIAKLFGQSRSSLIMAVLFVSTLIAASTGIIGATIIMLAMISLPTMLNAGISTRLSTGLICASGTLGQIIPPSIVLILLGDQISNAYLEAQQSIGNFAPEPVSVGDLFAGALIPGLVLVTLYAIYSLFVLSRYSGAVASNQNRVEHEASEDLPSVASLLIEIIPPLILIFSVLGSILFGVATPTEAASIGVAGTILIAAGNCNSDLRFVSHVVIVTVVLVFIAVIMQRYGLTKIDFIDDAYVFNPAVVFSILVALSIVAGMVYSIVALARDGILKISLSKTVEMSSMIFGIIIAASMLSLVFRGFEGDELVEGFLTGLPGGFTTMLVITMLVIFLLGFVLDFIEIVFIVIPIVGPILLQSDIHPVWFAILVALNIQTSFLTPPFGFALFYYRSVAPDEITTVEIYKSVIPFVILQLITIGIVVAFPLLATWLPDLLFH